MLQRKLRRTPLKQSCLVYCVILSSAILYIILIYRITNKALRQNAHQRYPMLKEPENLSCGEICSLTVNNRTSGMFYPLLTKQVKCLHMVHLLRRSPTPQDSHTRYSNQNEGSKNIYKEDYINELILKGAKEIEETTYPFVKRLFIVYEGVFYNKRGLVLGSQTPWMEAMLLSQHAKHLTTLDYNDNNVFIHPRISKYNPYKLSDIFLKSEVHHFDFAVSYDFVEQAGIGTKENQFDFELHGDIQTVAQVWCMLKPRGLFFLAVPKSQNSSSYVMFNSRRVYASNRLQHLTANFNVLDHFQSKESNSHTYIGMWVLQKLDI